MVSIQYLTQSVLDFQQINRILQPDRPLIIFYSNRMFPTKAIAVWHQAKTRFASPLLWAVRNRIEQIHAGPISGHNAGWLLQRGQNRWLYRSGLCFHGPKNSVRTSITSTKTVKLLALICRVKSKVLVDEDQAMQFYSGIMCGLPATALAILWR